jgi:hypothetical protein
MKVLRVVRNIEFNRLFDSFFIASIATVLVVRFYLQITGYPQIGSASLHISHLLPGTVCMLLAILLLLGAVNRSVRDFSALLAGVGFGLVWDELGKFITQDNNYFFKPTTGLIYLTFIGLYLGARYISGKRFTEDDYLANVLDVLKEAAIKDLDSREYAYAQELMTHVSPSHPLHATTHALMMKVRATKKNDSLLIDRVVSLVKKPLLRLSQWQFFSRLIILLAILYGLINISVAGWFFYDAFSSGDIDVAILKGHGSDIVGALSALLAAVYVVIGALKYLRGSRLEAYSLFEVALLINIFVGQVILFFINAGLAVFGLAAILVILVNTRLLIAEEQRRHLSKA